MELIYKDALVAEIKRISCENPMDNSWYVDTEELLDFLDTFEVKLEVDLKNELKEDWLLADKTEVDCIESMCLTEDMFVSLAKKYFELGMLVSNKAQKGEEA